MTVDRLHAYFSPEEYLEIEKTSTIKHEYIRGEVYAMAGASDAHVTITGNLFALLRNHLRGGNCRVYFVDMRVRIESANTFYYPDLIVTCDRCDRNNVYFKEYPRLIVEVLSPKTEKFDRTEKFTDYQQIETLEEYILIDQDRIQLEKFSRNNKGNWDSQNYLQGDKVELKSVDFSCEIGELYEDVVF